MRSSRKRPLSQAIMTTFGIRCSTRPFLVSGHSATTQSLIHIIQHLNETVHCGNGSLIKIFHSAVWQLYTAISRRLSEKMCTRQSRKVIWDMIDILFLTTVAVEPTLFLSVSTRKHIFMAFRANSFKFL